MPRRTVRWFLLQFLGAVLIGFATILVPKVDPRAHWSTPPTIEMHVEGDASVADGQPLA